MGIRVTNKMMTNSLLGNINNNKIRLDKLDQQYATGLKIQRPSDDPIVAVRALKLRTNLSELNQYYERNVPDAFSWMDVTEGALNEINDILTKVHSYCVQGATDTLTEKDRNDVVETLAQLKQQIYQEGSVNYAGRYVFSGYKTDTNLIFDDNTTQYMYQMTEPVAGTSIEVFKKSVNNISLDNYDADSADSFVLEDMPNIANSYRLNLAYSDIDLNDDGEGILTIQLPVRDADGNIEYDENGNVVKEDFDVTIKTTNLADPNAYKVEEEGTINFLADTGELIMPEDVYLALKDEEVIYLDYQKTKFNKNDLRPEHYFDCTRTNLLGLEGDEEIDEDNEELDILEFKKENQEIRYEINFNQKLVINTQGSDAIKHSMGRTIDDIINAVNDVIQCDNTRKEVDKMLDDPATTADQAAALKVMREALDGEFSIKTSIMQDIFSHALTQVEQQQNDVSAAVADLGARYVRLQLTESRLSSEQVDFEDLLSTNEDADLVETVVKYNAQETIYNAALSAASKVVQNSLLDFL